jgi:Bacteroidetes VLRF1 release factor/Vms1-associating treble clef domain
MQETKMKQPLGGVLLESITLYSERCVEYLTRALKKAESSVENDFRRYYETPQVDLDVHDWSSDEEGGRAAKSSDDDESEPDDDVLTSQSQLAIAQSVAQENKDESSSQPQTTINQNQQPKPAKKLTLNGKEKENAIRQMGRPPYALLPLSGPDGHMVEIPSALLSKDERLSSMFVHCDAYHRIATDLAVAKKPTVVLILRSGRFAGAIFTGPNCLHHTTSSRYTIRKGQGKAQSAQDGKRKPKSVGSQLRRAGEEALREDVKLFLRNQKAQVQSAGLVLLSCPKVMMKHFFDDNNDILPRGHNRLRKIPLDVGRPTFEAVVAVYEIMMKINIVLEPLRNGDAARDVPQVFPELLRPFKEKVEETETEKMKLVIPFTRLHELAATANLAELIQYISIESDFEIDQPAGEDFMTPLHVAADSAHHMDPTVSAACVTALLVQGRANPTVLDARSRAPYFLASHAKVRDAFRIARATLGEDYCNWENAKVGPPLTVDDLETKKEKAAEKKRRQRARQKEKNQREAAHIEEMERKRNEERERQKEQEEAKRMRDGLQPKTSTATNVCDFCLKPSKGKRRSQMFQRLDYAYCSSECVQNHKRELMAKAALARFG